jgi:hypothetical protein
MGKYFFNLMCINSNEKIENENDAQQARHGGIQSENYENCFFFRLAASRSF